jgi:hypothetical protein
MSTNPKPSADPTVSTAPKRTVAQVRAEIELERNGLGAAVGELRSEAAVAAGQAKRVGVVAVAVLGTFGVVRGLLQLRR